MSEAPRSAGSRQFPETHWSRLLELADVADPRHVEHLNQLLQRYWKPTYHYLRAMRRLSAEDAEDLTQGFFTMVLSRVDFADLSPDRGSFRGFLKTALRRFVVAEERKGTAQKRSAGRTMFPFAAAEALYSAESKATPEETFDREWAREVLNQSVDRLREELQQEGKAVYYEIFKEYCVDPAPEISYDLLAERHGIKVDDVRNHLRFARQRGRQIIRSMLRNYLLPGESLETELRFILSR